jgi:hypothetical protein
MEAICVKCGRHYDPPAEESNEPYRVCWICQLEQTQEISKETEA